MKRVLGLILLLGLASLVMPIMQGAVVTLTFEGLKNLEAVNNFYNGGTGGSGSSGTNYGIGFSSNSLALIDSAHGGSGNQRNEPSGDTALFFLSGTGDIMNVAAGFNTGFSFFYADQVGRIGSVNVYSGLDGTGSLLASLSLPSTPNPYNVFVPIGVTFAGTAKSVDFGGSANYIVFDDVTLGSSTPGGSVPEPTSVILFGTLFALVAIPLRKKLIAHM